MSSIWSVSRTAILLVAVGFLACGRTGQLETNKNLVRGYMEEVLNQGNLEVVERYFPEEGYMLNGRLISREQLGGMREAILSRFPDFHLTIEDQIAADDKVVTRVTFRGTHRGEFRGIAPTGRRVEYGGIAIDRIENGRVVEGWHQADELGMLRQLGVVPTP